MDKASARRTAKNEVFFRQQNENIERGFEQIRTMAAEDNQESFLHTGDPLIHFYCECADEDCRQRVPVKQSVYNAIHKQRDQFIIVPGHDVPDIEDVIDRQPTYYVVRKHVIPPQTPDGLHDTTVHNT
jgi:hypothetical protein